MSTAIFSAIAIKDSTQAAAKAVQDEFGSSLSLQSSFDNAPNTFKGEGIIPATAIEQLSKIPGVEGYVTQAGAMPILPKAELVSLGKYNEPDESIAAKFGNFAQLEGTSDTSRNNKFATKSLKLESGTHIGKDDVHKALIHEQFAKKNGLSVGDTFTVAANAMDRGNKNKSDASVELTVAGIFSGESLVATSTRYDLFGNIILTDLTTISDLYKVKPEDQLFSTAVFHLAAGADTDKVLAQAKALPIDWKKFDVIKNDGDLAGIASSAAGIMSMVNTMIVLTIVFSIVILALILFLWLHGRRREAGVMFSVGVGKGKVLAQFVCELALVAVIAFGFSALTGDAVAQSIGDNMTSQSTQSTRQDIMRQTGGMLAADADTSSVMKTIEKIDVQANPEYLVWVDLIGLSVIVVTVLVSSIPLMRARPRDLLTRMK